jgi:hypothetical protein
VRRAASLVLLAVVATGSFPARAGTPLPGPHPIASEDDCNDPPKAPPAIAPPAATPATLEPARSTVRLAYGAGARRTYTLTRPASPTPVDILFLVDTTGSMGGAICGVQVGLTRIALDLHDAGIDARFGVAEYKDYPFQPWGEPDDVAYRRQRDIGPLDEGLIRAVHRLRADGGGDGPESALTALYQAATGAGQDVRPKGRSRGDIAAGRRANFRPDALKVIVNVTDVTFHRRASGYPGPAWDTVVDALGARAILQAGIAIDGSGRDLSLMADDTGALAPRAVDCDGDGRTDIARGEPLVCSLPSQPVISLGDPPKPVRLAPAIVEMVKAIRDFARVDPFVTGDPAIVRRVRPDPSEPIDLKASNTVRFSVGYRCRARAGTHRVHLGTRVRGEVIARATIKVLCDPPPFVAVAPPLAAAAAAPPQVPAPQPQAQSQPQAAPHTNVQPNAAPVPQQQEQAQTAMVQAFDDAIGAQARLGATSRRRAGPATWLLFAAALVTAAAGLASSRARLEHARASRAEDDASGHP